MCPTPWLMSLFNWINVIMETIKDTKSNKSIKDIATNFIDYFQKFTYLEKTKNFILEFPQDIRILITFWKVIVIYLDRGQKNVSDWFLGSCILQTANISLPATIYLNIIERFFYPSSNFRCLQNIHSRKSKL